MRRNWTPSIVPADCADQTVYLVLDDIGRLAAPIPRPRTGRSGNRIADLMSGQYGNPIRVVAFQHRRALG